MAQVTFRYTEKTKPRRVLVQDGLVSYAVGTERPWICPGAFTEDSVTFVADTGFWGVTVEVKRLLEPGPLLIEFPPLPAGGPLGWWHHLQGISDPRAPRGHGIRIGVIDEGLPKQGRDSSISHIHNDGGLPVWGVADAPRAINPTSIHSEQVCALLAARGTGGNGYDGIVPDAEVFFTSARVDEEENPRLKTQRVMTCIEYLSAERQCDVISVSAGDVKTELPGLLEVLKTVARLGTVCFFASGNSGVVRYPAQYDECFAVAALGSTGGAPAGTDIAKIDQSERLSLDAGPLYLWSCSGRGISVDYCAPGVGVIWSRDGKAAGALAGTSFACPIAAGVAGLLLSRDAKYLETSSKSLRYDRAREILTAPSSYDPLGAPRSHNFWKYGLLRV